MVKRIFAAAAVIIIGSLLVFLTVSLEPVREKYEAADYELIGCPEK